MRLKHRQKIPHGGKWVATEPRTGLTLTSFVDFYDLIRQFKEYYQANDWPIGLDFENEVEQWLCKSLPKECVPDGPPPSRRHLHMSDVLRGLLALSGIIGARIRAVLGGESPFVEQAEASRRAKICQSCLYNTQFKRPCSGLCPELKRMVDLIKGNRKTSYDDELKSCSICGCYTSTSVWIRLDLQTAVLTDAQKITFQQLDWCWKGKL